MQQIYKPFLWTALLSGLLVFLLSSTASAQQFLTKVNGMNAYVHLPDDYSSTTSNYPLIVFIPGVGEIGTDPSKLIAYGPSYFVGRGHNMQFLVNGVTEKPIVISIQPVTAWPKPDFLKRTYDSIMSRWRVDARRIYLTGLSMGGWSHDNYITSSEEFANFPAAIVAMSSPPSTFNSTNYKWFAQAGGKWWGIEGNTDQRGNTKTRDTLNKYQAGCATYTLYEGGHCCWNTFYDPAWTQDGQSIYTFMLSQRKGAVPVEDNIEPTANAGADVSVTLPRDSVVLTGTGRDVDGAITDYDWTKVSGPSLYDIVSATSARTIVTDHVAGTYKYVLTVTDNKGDIGRDTVVVTVLADTVSKNTLPVADAGPTQTITSSGAVISLAGRGSDADGTIVSYDWKVASAPYVGTIANRAAASTTVSGLPEGQSVLRLTITDNGGAKSISDVIINMDLIPAPTGNGNANAGKDMLLYKNQVREDTIFLRGSTLTASGTPTYSWRAIGNASISITNSATSNARINGHLAHGVYKFELTVRDSAGTSRDTVVASVIDYMRKNMRPCRTGKALAFTLERTDADQLYRPYITRDGIFPGLMGGDTLYIPGGKYATGIEIGDIGGSPGCPIIIAPKDAPVVITNNGFLRLGSRDSAVVCYARFDGTLLRSKGFAYGFVVDNSDKLPSELTSAGLTCNWVHHVDISGYRVNHSALGMMVKLNARPIVQGQYDKFLLRKIVIHDNFIFRSNGEGMYIGHTGVSGTVSGNSTAYGPPARMDSVEIYNNFVDSTNLDGIQLSNALSGSGIANNFVRRYGVGNQTNQQVGIIGGGNTNNVRIYNNMVVNGLGAGIAIFGHGTAAVFHNILDSMRSGKGNQDGIYFQQNGIAPEDQPVLSPNVYDNIIKNSERNPVFLANNGATKGGNVSDNYFINNTVNSVGNGSLTTVGNNTTSIKTFPILVNSVGMVANGVSVKITQGDSSRAFTSIKEMVNWVFDRLPASNRYPVANAGSDTAINPPSTTALLNGGGTDSDGSISSYKWTKIAGPDSFQLVSPTAPRTELKNLQQGTYQFMLSVTDNFGASDSDYVQVIVNPDLAGSTTKSTGIVFGEGGVNPYKSIQSEKSLVLYPNPTSSVLNIKYYAPGKAINERVIIIITDGVGNTVYYADETRTSATFQTKISVSQLRDGLYFLRLSTVNADTFIKSFIKN